MSALSQLSQRDTFLVFVVTNYLFFASAVREILMLVNDPTLPYKQAFLFY